MIKTGCVYNDNDIAESVGARILVMRFVPKKLSDESGRWDYWLSQLAPEPESLFKFRNKEIRFQEYAVAYLKRLREGIAPFLVLSLTTHSFNSDIMLLCCEKTSTFCHRRILQELMETLTEMGRENLLWQATLDGYNEVVTDQTNKYRSLSEPRD